MDRHFGFVCCLTGVVVALAWATLLTRFHSAIKPDEFTLVAPMFFLLIGLVGEAGLFLAAAAARRSSLVVQIAALLALLPPLWLHGAATFDFVGLVGLDHPLFDARLFVLVCVMALLVHMWAFGRIARTVFTSKREPAG